MVDNFQTYKKIKILGNEDNKDIFSNPEDEIFIQEKIDGANFRFMVKNNKIIFGSRTQQLTSDEGDDINVSKNFRRCVEHIRTSFIPSSIYEGFIYYGECNVKHTINYDWEKIPPFLGFDILDIVSDKYISPVTVSFLYNNMNLTTVPLISKTTAGEIKEVNDAMVPISVYASPSNKDMKAEGIVFKNYAKQLFAKYVRNEFKERNAEVFGGNPKYNNEGQFDDAELVFKYCTNPRIDKIVFKLVDEGYKLDHTMMRDLIRRVIADIYEESWKEILDSNWKLDLKNIRGLIAKRCLAVLSQIITNNALN